MVSLHMVYVCYSACYSLGKVGHLLLMDHVRHDVAHVSYLLRCVRVITSYQMGVSIEHLEYL